MLSLAFMSPLIVWRQLHAIDADLPMIKHPRAFARQHVDQFLRGAAAGARRAELVRPRRATAQSVMTNPGVRRVLRSFSLLVVAALAAAGCGAGADTSGAAAEAAAVNVSATPAAEQPMTRFIRVSGTLTPQEDAEVAAEIAGRVVATPVERGSLVRANDALIQIAATEVEAQAREAQANAAQIEARLGLDGGAAFDPERVPEVANAKAGYELSRSEFGRAQRLYDDKLLSQSDFDQRSAQMEATQRQYDVAQNGAAQQYQALLGARARVTVAQKALADTVVRAPFAGAVGERFVSVGDYVTRGTKVASVVRIDPLRVELTVPEQYVSAVAVGRAVTFEVDAYPGETFTGQVRYRLAVGDGVDARADARSDRAECQRPAQAGILRHRADRGGAEAARHPGALGRGSHRRRHGARVRDQRRSRRRTHRHDRPGGRRRRWRSPAASRPASGSRPAASISSSTASASR